MTDLYARRKRIYAQIARLEEELRQVNREIDESLEPRSFTLRNSDDRRRFLELHAANMREIRRGLES